MSTVNQTKRPRATGTIGRPPKNVVVQSKVAQAVAVCLERAAENGKSQVDIAEELGLVSEGRASNFLSLVKNGRCKLPVEQVEPFLKACGVTDGGFLVEAMADEYFGSFIALMKKHKHVSYSKAESEVMNALIEAKAEADSEMKREGMAKAETRTDIQRAQYASKVWRTDKKSLVSFKDYIKKNMLSV